MHTLLLVRCGFRGNSSLTVTDALKIFSLKTKLDLFIYLFFKYNCCSVEDLSNVCSVGAL